jgi:hypothetical protein
MHRNSFGPADLTVLVEHHAVGFRVVSGEPRLGAENSRVLRNELLRCFGLTSTFKLSFILGTQQKGLDGIEAFIEAGADSYAASAVSAWTLTSASAILVSVLSVFFSHVPEVFEGTG